MASLLVVVQSHPDNKFRTFHPNEVRCHMMLFIRPYHQNCKFYALSMVFGYQCSVQTTQCLTCITNIIDHNQISAIYQLLIDRTDNLEFSTFCPFVWLNFNEFNGHFVFEPLNYFWNKHKCTIQYTNNDKFGIWILCKGLKAIGINLSCNPVNLVRYLLAGIQLLKFQVMALHNIFTIHF